nr:hypothetical protein Iba_chr12cCG4200 [Ipomoea batatas]GMD67514.1 hypothetical protein Iba_chr12dCG0270 [Ipomoea batatas]GMD69859.1 hypothetical protein Iba_chr12eCG0710 [Ipomoea batatas]
MVYNKINMKVVEGYDIPETAEIPEVIADSPPCLPDSLARRSESESSPRLCESERDDVTSLARV